MKKEAALKHIQGHIGGSTSKTANRILNDVASFLVQSGYKKPFKILRAQIGMEDPAISDTVSEQQEISEQMEDNLDRQAGGIDAIVDISKRDGPFIAEWEEIDEEGNTVPIKTQVTVDQGLVDALLLDNKTSIEGIVTIEGDTVDFTANDSSLGIQNVSIPYEPDIII